MTIFLYDNVNHELRLNEPEILLIKEFAELWTNDRNISKEDPKGIKKLRAFKSSPTCI